MNHVLNAIVLNDLMLLAQRGNIDLGNLSLSRILLIGGIIIAAFIALIMVVIIWSFGSLWFQAWMSNADVKMFSLVGMYFRQVRPQVIVNAKIMAAQSGLDIDPPNGVTTERLEAHYLAGGNVMNVIYAIIAAHRAKINLDFDRAAAIDLAGRDVLDAVKTSVHPKVIDCPDPVHATSRTLSAIARDGVELKVTARVTVRTNLDQLIGGATEETIIARVGESIISAIGSVDTHSQVLEKPNLISEKVLNRGLDNQTAFRIVSIDIANIEVGQNIGARLRADQAEADTRMAQAQAERRRAEAIATEQVMRAKTAENRAALVLAESEVPKAMAVAIRDSDFDMSGSKT